MVNYDKVLKGNISKLEKTLGFWGAGSSVYYSEGFRDGMIHCAKIFMDKKTFKKLKNGMKSMTSLKPESGSKRG